MDKGEGPRRNDSREGVEGVGVFASEVETEVREKVKRFALEILRGERRIPRYLKRARLILLFKNGRVIWQHTGVASAAQIRAAMEPVTV